MPWADIGLAPWAESQLPEIGVAKKIAQQLHRAGGSLEKLSYQDCPKGLRNASFTHLPQVDWSKVKRVQTFPAEADVPGLQAGDYFSDLR